jgi:hypothetical protein
VTHLSAPSAELAACARLRRTLSLSRAMRSLRFVSFSLPNCSLGAADAEVKQVVVSPSSCDGANSWLVAFLRGASSNCWGGWLPTRCNVAASHMRPRHECQAGTVHGATFQRSISACAKVALSPHASIHSVAFISASIRESRPEPCASCKYLPVSPCYVVLTTGQGVPQSRYLHVWTLD